MWSGHLVYCALTLSWHQIVVTVVVAAAAAIINIDHYFSDELNWYRTLDSDNNKCVGYNIKRCSVTMLVNGNKHFWYVICKYACNTLSWKIWDLLFLATIFHISSLLERGKRIFSHDYSISKKVTFIYIYMYISP